MIKYNQYNLKKIETILKESGYRVRYGKGNFHAGYCIMDQTNNVVVNKYYSIEAKMACLIEILQQVEIKDEGMDESQMKFYKALLKEKKVPLETPTAS